MMVNVCRTVVFGISSKGAPIINNGGLKYDILGPQGALKFYDAGFHRLILALGAREGPRDTTVVQKTPTTRAITYITFRYAPLFPESTQHSAHLKCLATLVLLVGRVWVWQNKRLYVWLPCRFGTGLSHFVIIAGVYHTSSDRITKLAAWLKTLLRK